MSSIVTSIREYIKKILFDYRLTRMNNLYEKKKYEKLVRMYAKQEDYVQLKNTEYPILY
jgi:hypothetical protein